MTETLHLALLGAGVIACLAAVAWVVLPVARGTVPLAPPDPRVVALLARREAILANLRDLDADRADGRLGEAEHARMRADVVQQGADVLAALDRISAMATRRAETLLAALEADVSARLGTLTPTARPATGDAGPPAPARPATDDAGPPAPTRPATDDAGPLAPAPPVAVPAVCAECGAVARAGDRYCAACGHPLGPVVA